jgi:transcription-repair coupling factor (superfamily II helicase)
MSLETLLPNFLDCCYEIVIALKRGDSLPALNLRRSARIPVLATISTKLRSPILLLTDRTDRAIALAEELALWMPQVPRQIFPEPPSLFYEQAAWGETTRRDRLLVLTTLASYHIPGTTRPIVAPIIIVPARALMTRTIPRRDYIKATLNLRQGQELQPEELARTCTDLGYEAANIVVAPGFFARRGGILDLWPPADPQPVRLEFFGDEIETIRHFDPSTQRTIKQVSNSSADRILVSSAREYITKQGSIMHKNGEPITEFHIPIVHTTVASLLDYLPKNALVLIDDAQSFEDTILEAEEQATNLRLDYIQDGTLPIEFPIPYLTLSEIQDSLFSHQTLELGPPSTVAIETASTDQLQSGSLSTTLSEKFSSGPRFGGKLKHFMEYITNQHKNGDRLVIVSRQTARLKELWHDQNQYSSSDIPMFIENSLAEGWIFESLDGSRLHLLTDGEIFGWRRPEPRRRVRPIVEAPETVYSDLQMDDLVVHVDHGIGRFKGLVQRTVDRMEREFLCVEYENEAQLFVPVHQADRLTRYIGSDSRNTNLSRLGGTEWRKTKSRVKEAVETVAEDLLELYAKRSVVEGYAFGHDTDWQHELEASFPYIETDDQIRVITDVKQDMHSKRPMDRLICGDVGYGKTEVALRAAFKAVMENKQVAMLVPTTVLAQQHFNTFRQRIATFPVEVEMLSRFRTQKQQRTILSRMANGNIDILIGTHRLLSSDVKFKDLGLLIIDEEQRFGVTHKESLKKIRTEVDVLTLTATPIPRTLYMALSGVRDISTINTPPEERLPVVTHIGPYSPRLTRQAIIRELERGGQVFFVHNRVQTIRAMQSHLNRLVPEARIAIAHGQMPETDLSQRMELFTGGEIDVLLSTSIIESGLDIPNANTLIVDRADTFGLAQLYQLRGRVGRGAQRAYAYFFRHNRKSPTKEGRQRLETIAENTHLGAGYSIAMRDLEIRGSGDILGTRQHGNIAAVGFHLYTRLLADVVRRLRVVRKIPEIPHQISSPAIQLNIVNVDLPIPTSIPSDYVPNKTVRLGLYRRIADARSLDELDALFEEFSDRFGKPPTPVFNLFFQLKVKLLAERVGLSSISGGNGQLVLRFPDEQVPLSLPYLGPYVRVGKTALWMQYQHQTDWLSFLLEILHQMEIQK